MTEGTANVANAIRHLNEIPPARPPTPPPTIESNNMGTPTKRSGFKNGPPSIKIERKTKARERMEEERQKKIVKMYDTMEEKMTVVGNQSKA